MKLIIERKATFKNNSDTEVKVTQKKSSRAFLKQDMLNSQIHLTSQALRWSLPSK